MFAKVRNLLSAGVVFASVLTTQLQVGAASYYVDYAGGNDSNNGSSANSAWQHCPGDVLATGNPARTALNGGDTVYFKGGVSYVLAAPNTNTTTAGIGLNWNGTPGNPIIYDGNTSGAWGTGRAIFTDNCSANGICAFYSAGNGSNLVFNSLMLGPIGGQTNLAPDPTRTIAAPNGLPSKNGGGISFAGFANNIVVSNCCFSQLGYYQNFAPMGQNSVKGGGFGSADAYGVTITNCEFFDMAYPIYFNVPNLCANVDIGHCYFHDAMIWGIAATLTSVNSYRSNFFVHDCQILNTDQAYVDQSQGGAWTGYGGGGGHQDFMFLFGLETAYGAIDRPNADVGVRIYNNFFQTTTTYAGGTAWLYFSDSPSADIYNNVFDMPAAVAAIQFVSPATNTPFMFRVFNNTVYKSYNPFMIFGGDGLLNWVIASTNVLIQVENNVIYDSYLHSSANYGMSIAFNGTNGVRNFLVDYNDYRTFNGLQLIITWQKGYGGDLSLGSVRNFGWELHGSTNDPMFMSLSNNFHLSASSPDKSSGANLASLNMAGLDADHDGNPRVAAGAGGWSLGAYQYGGTIGVGSTVITGMGSGTTTGNTGTGGSSTSGGGSTTTTTTNQAPPAPQGLHIVNPKG